METDTTFISLLLQLESTSVKTTQVVAYTHSHCLNSLSCGNVIMYNSLFALLLIFCLFHLLHSHRLATWIYFSNKIKLSEAGDNIKHTISRISGTFLGHIKLIDIAYNICGVNAVILILLC